MTELSPAALAVRDAAEKQTDLDFRFAPTIAAAALEAAADQVVPELSGGCDAYDCCITQCEQIRAELLAIAAELKGNSNV